MKRFSTYATLMLMAFALASPSTSQAALVNGDFSDPNFSAFLPTSSLKYGHLNTGWAAKQAGVNWIIAGGQMTQPSRTGSETRFGQFFTNDLSGTGFRLELDLGGPGNITADDIQLFGAVDDGNNDPDDDVTGFGNENTPNAGIGTWVELIHVIDVPTGAISLEITEDLGLFDIMVLRIGSPRGNLPGGINQPNNGLTVDNIRFVSAAVPEPATAGLALLGLTVMAKRRRRLI